MNRGQKPSIPSSRRCRAREASLSDALAALNDAEDEAQTLGARLQSAEQDAEALRGELMAVNGALATEGQTAED
ncbi:MAG: hypothetical protein ACOCUJ_03220, partial [Thiohalospira sp.]